MLVKSEIINLLNRALGQTPKLRKGGDQLVYFCSVCHHHKRKMEICLKDGPNFGMFNCWTCGTTGNLKKLLSIIDAPSSDINALYGLTSDIEKIRKKLTKRVPKSDISLPSEFLPLADVKTTPEYKNAICYLKRRGIGMDDIIRYNIGYCEDGEYSNHIIIPSYDAKGKLNFFIGRRYYDTEGVIPFKKPIASMDIVGFELLINYNEPLILVEAAFNAITIRNNAIPLFGKFPSSKLYESMIINGVKTVYVCLDSDARKEAISVCDKLLRLGITPYFVRMDGKDPNEVGFEKMCQHIRNAEEYDFQFKQREKMNSI